MEHWSCPFSERCLLDAHLHWWPRCAPDLEVDGRLIFGCLNIEHNILRYLGIKFGKESSVVHCISGSAIKYDHSDSFLLKNGSIRSAVMALYRISAGVLFLVHKVIVYSPRIASTATHATVFILCDTHLCQWALHRRSRSWHGECCGDCRKSPTLPAHCGQPKPIFRKKQQAEATTVCYQSCQNIRFLSWIRRRTVDTASWAAGLMDSHPHMAGYITRSGYIYEVIKKSPHSYQNSNI